MCVCVRAHVHLRAYMNLSRNLNCKRVMMAVPNYLRSTPPPVVSYTYTRTIAGKIFNHRKVVEELDMDNGTDDIKCSCSSSSYRYEPCGHIVTGDLSIIRDITVRNLIKKGPSYREQNNIDWKVNEKTSKEAVSRYCQKWAKAACVDKRVLRDWKETMYSCIDERIKMLQQLHLNKRKKQVLKSKVHLDYLNKLHDNFVLLSIRVEFAGSKIAITTAKFGGLKKKLYPIAALKLGFMMICAISPYSIPVKS